MRPKEVSSEGYFLTNVLDLDSTGRIHSMHFLNQQYSPLASPQLIPVLPLLGVESAFPSIIHRWIFVVLWHRKMPKRHLNLCKGIYTNARATLTHNGVKYIIIYFVSGVLQGCPGSAFLFNNALDPFFRLLVKYCKEKRAGIIRACADDLGAALRAAKYLKCFAPILADAQSFAGLTLNPSSARTSPGLPWPG